MKYLIGIDGGGTNSRLIAVSEEGQVLGRSRGRSTNLESNSIATVKEHLNNLIRKAITDNGLRLKDCAALCIGTAGVDTERARLRYEGLLATMDWGIPCRAVNDVVIALYAQTQGAPGLMILAGTGSIAYGIDREGRQWRCGGFGHIVADEGSGYWVAREGATAALRAFDRSGPPTRLTEDIRQKLNFQEFDEILEFVYGKNKSDLAQLSHVVTHAEAQGDPIAQDIMQRAELELVRMTAGVIEELKMGDDAYPMIFGGGFLRGCDSLREGVKRRLLARYPKLLIREMQEEAEWGAIYMAAGMAGLRLPQQDPA